MESFPSPFGVNESPFENKTALATGNYSELTAMSAMIARGRQVAVPFGNQHGWDFLVELDGWKRVQVKTAKPVNLNGYVVSLWRGSKTKNKTYSRKDADFIAAVLPATGSIWMLPIELVEGKLSVALTDEYLWVVGDRPAPPQLTAPEPIVFQRPSKAKLRMALRTIPHLARPDSISDASWDMLIKYRDGFSYGLIATQYGARPDTIRDRVIRVAKRIFRENYCPMPMCKIG